MQNFIRHIMSNEEGAIVKGPLFSIEARGQIAQAMVHFPWKGRALVRRWLTPSNPRDIDQKLIRQKMACFGKNAVKVTTPTALVVNGSKFYKLLKAVTPATQIWNAYLAKAGMDAVKLDANFVAASTALFATTMQTYWVCNAAALGFETLTGDQFATSISPELQLFVGAIAAYELGLCDTTHNYSTYPSRWASNVISQFATNFTVAGD